MVILYNVHNSRLSTVANSRWWITDYSRSGNVDNSIALKRQSYPLQLIKVIHRPVDNFTTLK